MKNCGFQSLAAAVFPEAGSEAGAACAVALVATPLRGADGEIYALCGISTDITQIKHYQKELERLSQYDELTGLCNRRHFMGLARHELGRSQRYGGKLSLLMVDIDHFKSINDKLGHEAGDAVLCAIARRLKSKVRESDLVARLGGDEFAVLLPHLGDPAQASRIAGERLSE
mgnify:CR=1 FL=1